MTFRTPASLLSFALAGLLLPRAHAAEVTDLASSFQPGKPFEAHVSLGYARRLYRGAVRRERVGRADDQMRVEVAKELRFSQVTHVLSPRVEVGLWKDLQLHFELPVTVSNTRSFDFEQNGGGDCGDPPETNCVTPDNSTIVRDELVDGTAMESDQVAVGNGEGPPGGLQLPERRGIDQLYIGLSWGPWNQARDHTKPSWVVGIESRVALGSAMTYDPEDPLANRAVGRRVHEFRFHTDISKRFGYFEPWFSAYYLLPLADGSSLYNKTSFENSGQQRAGPQHVTGANIGVEIVPWERKRDKSKLTIELSTGMQATLAGRGYSPVWELFANNPVLTGPCHPSFGNARPQATPEWNNGTYCADVGDTIPHPGITNIDGYLTFTGTLAVNLRITRYAHLRMGMSLGHEQARLITNEFPGQADENNGTIDPEDPLQWSPMHRTLIDLPGKRFRVEETTIFDLFVTARAMF